MKYVIPAAIAIGVGLVILLTYLFPAPDLLPIRQGLVDWAVILGGLAVLVGMLNLIIVHGRRVQSGDKGWLYSVLTLLAALLTLGLGVYESYGASIPAIARSNSLTNVLFEGMIVASLATLSSLVLIALVVAAMKMLKKKPDAWSIAFLIVVVIVLVGWIPLSYTVSLYNVREWILQVPVMAGARGILLGVALGTVVMGLRVLIGVERPYKD